jgi:hypothetical protein
MVLLCSAGKKRGSWLGHGRGLTENTDLFYLSKRVGEETSVMNVDCRFCVVSCETRYVSRVVTTGV